MEAKTILIIYSEPNFNILLQIQIAFVQRNIIWLPRGHIGLRYKYSKKREM